MYPIVEELLQSSSVIDDLGMYMHVGMVARKVILPANRFYLSFDSHNSFIPQEINAGSLRQSLLLALTTLATRALTLTLRYLDTDFQLTTLATSLGNNVTHIFGFPPF